MKRKMTAIFAGTMLVITSSTVATNLLTQNVADGSFSDSTLVAASDGKK